MQKNLFLWQFFGLTFAFLFGTLFHFLYIWTDVIAFAPFCAVNESTWEHMKILFFPMLIFAFIQRPFFKRNYPQYWAIKCLGIVTGITLIPILFYTYNGAFGASPTFVNILFFFLADAAGFALEWYLFRKNKLQNIRSVLPLLVLVLLAVLFVVFTFRPPTLPLFQDPQTLLYGIV